MDNTEKKYINFILAAEQRYNTHEVRVSLETAKMLQKVGFDWECECAILPGSLMADKAYHYNHNGSHNYNNKEAYSFEIYSAPSLDVAQRWLREVKNISVEAKSFRWVNRYQDGKYTVTYRHELWPIDTSIIHSEEDKFIRYTLDCACDIEFQTYEQALEAGIKKCLTLLLEEKK